MYAGLVKKHLIFRINILQVRICVGQRRNRELAPERGRAGESYETTTCPGAMRGSNGAD